MGAAAPTIGPTCRWCRRAALTTAQRQAIGALCYDAGVSVKMQYASGSSGADPTEIVPALSSVFFYSNAICGGDGDNIGSGLTGMLNPNLDAGFPCLLTIYATNGAGHEIVADGYGYDSSTLYHHLNLGWGGYDNAWYNLPDFDAGGYNWDDRPFCIYNVYPTGSGEIISGRITDSTGATVSGATVTAARAGGGVYSAATNANGIYAFANVPSASSYTLTAARTGYTFPPQIVSTGTSANYNTASGDVWGANFTATTVASTWTLTVNSSPAQGAAVTGTYAGMTDYSIPSVSDGTAVSLTAPAKFVSGGTTYNFVQWAVPAGWTASGATVSGNISSDTTLHSRLRGAGLDADGELRAGSGSRDYRDVSRNDELFGLRRDRRHGGEPDGAGRRSGRIYLLAVDGERRGADFRAEVHHVHDDRGDDRRGAVCAEHLRAERAVHAADGDRCRFEHRQRRDDELHAVPASAYGASVNLQAPATDPAGYTFSQWTLNGAAQASGQKAITFTMTAATTAVAQYALNAYALNVQSTPPTGLSIGSSTGDGGATNYTIPVIASGASVNLQAPATDPAGYTFSQWTLNGAAQTFGSEGDHVHGDRGDDRPRAVHAER